MNADECRELIGIIDAMDGCRERYEAAIAKDTYKASEQKFAERSAWLEKERDEIPSLPAREQSAAYLAFSEKCIALTHDWHKAMLQSAEPYLAFLGELAAADKPLNGFIERMQDKYARLAVLERSWAGRKQSTRAAAASGFAAIQQDLHDWMEKPTLECYTGQDTEYMDLMAAVEDSARARRENDDMCRKFNASGHTDPADPQVEQLLNNEKILSAEKDALTGRLMNFANRADLWGESMVDYTKAFKEVGDQVRAQLTSPVVPLR